MPRSNAPLEILCSRHFLQWLNEEQISLALTTYQTHRLFLIGLKSNGRLSAFERFFDRPMGLSATSERLYMSSRYQVWQFDNVLGSDETHNSYDRLFVPHIGYTTGDLDIHDIAVDKNQRIVFVNTLYSCLATLSDRYSFKPIWQPHFISDLAPEDRCHLNGLAMQNGEPRYVTAVSQSDVVSGWRERRHNGGCLIDIQSNRVLLSGLSMPHSPRFYQDKLWLLNSGTGEFGYADIEQGRFEPVTFCPGYLRGLAFYRDLAIVGLSKPRSDRAFSDLALDDRLARKDTEPRCGLMMIDIKTGHIIHWLQFEGIITELYDVQVLPQVRCPMSLGFKTDEIGQMITIDQPELLTVHPLPIKNQIENDNQYQFHPYTSITLETVLTDYKTLTFPNFQKKAQNKLIKTPLVAVVTTCNNQPIGLIVAEVHPEKTSAEVLSFFVKPEFRGQGIGTRLLTSLESNLAEQQVAYVDLTYQSNWPSQKTIEALLQKQGWATPQARMLLCKSNAEYISKAPWLEQSKHKLPSEATVFLWSELTLQERQTIENRQDYPSILSPFQEEDKLEPTNSLGIRYQEQVVAWIITHRVAPDTVQYTSFFIQEKYRDLGWAIFLLADSIQRQMVAKIPNGSWMVDTQNKPMIRFIQHHLQPYLVSLTTVHCSRKHLGVK